MPTPSLASQAVRRVALEQEQYRRRLAVVYGSAVIFGFAAGGTLCACLLIWAARTHAMVDDRFATWVAGAAY